MKSAEILLCKKTFSPDDNGLVRALSEALPGDKIFMPAGIFRWPPAVKVPDGVTIIGSNNFETVFDGTVYGTRLDQIDGLYFRGEDKVTQ